jgi:hypothetical protein
MWKVIMIVSFIGSLSCGDPQGEECEGAVDVQFFNNTAQAVDLVVTGPKCSNALTVPFSQDGVPSYVFSGNFEGNEVIEYTVNGMSTQCTVHPDGIEKTYVRAQFTPGGTVECDCGFNEFSDNDQCF